MRVLPFAAGVRYNEAMNKMIDVLQIVLPVLAAMALGYMAKRRQVVSKAGIEGLKTFVIRFTLPMVLFGVFYDTAYSRNIFLCALTVFVCCVLGLLAGYALVKLTRGKEPLLAFLCTGFEVGMIGFALYTMLFGEEQLANLAMLDLGQELFVFTVYVTLLNVREGAGLARSLRDMVKTPVLVAILLGVLLGVSGLGAKLSASKAGGVLNATLSFLSAPTGCAILFVVGYEIQISRQSLRAALSAAALRLGLMAAICALCLLALRAFMQVTPQLFWAAVLLFSLPAPFVLPLYVHGEAEESYISTCLSVYTLLSVALFALIAALA